MLSPLAAPNKATSIVLKTSLNNLASGELHNPFMLRIQLLSVLLACCYFWKDYCFSVVCLKFIICFTVATKENSPLPRSLKG